jgi:hypothetical protein
VIQHVPRVHLAKAAVDRYRDRSGGHGPQPRHRVEQRVLEHQGNPVTGRHPKLSQVAAHPRHPALERAEAHRASIAERHECPLAVALRLATDQGGEILIARVRAHESLA